MRSNALIPISIVLSGVIIAGAVLYARPSPGNNRGLALAERAIPNSAGHVGRTAEVSVTDADPSLGNPNAPVTLIAFEDFECPFCGRFNQQTLPSLIQNEIKQGKVRLVWKDFPLSIHAHAEKAHEAGRCAWEQGKFWEYHDALFSNQRNLGESDLKRYAKNLGFNENQFSSCFDSGKYASLIQEKVDEGISAGVNGTPAFLINGRLVVGAQPYQVFADAIAQAAQ